MPNNNTISTPLNGNLTRFPQQSHRGAQQATYHSNQSDHHHNRMLVLANGLHSAHNNSHSPTISDSSTHNPSRSTSNSTLNDFSNRILQRSATNLKWLRTQTHHAKQNALNYQRQIVIFTQQLIYWKNHLTKLSSELPRDINFLDNLQNGSLPEEISDCFLSRKNEEIEAAKANSINAEKQYENYLSQLKQKQDDHELITRLLKQNPM
jgi:hypothetical protein